jgi:ABC-type transport system involved in cytochrome c biogenesis ATPase subunit
MKIRRIIAHRVKSILRLDHSLYDDWLGRVVDGLMVIGPNGAGKSTLLEGIAALWEEWGNWLDATMIERGGLIPVGPRRRKRGEPANLPTRHKLFAQPNFGLLAIQLVDLDLKRPIWLVAGGKDEVTQLKRDHPDDYIVAAVGQRRDEDRHLQDWGLDWPGAPKDQSWLGRWAEQRRRSLLGVAEMPNLLYFEPDNRQLLAPRDELDIARDLQDPDIFNWVARYEPAARRAGHLSSMLYRMQVTHPEGLKTILDDINTYLRNKHIEGFATSGDLEVMIAPPREREAAIKHLVYELSSGERQVFIFVAMLHRWLHKGGLVLIDEPDLHLHPSLCGALLSRLQRIVAKQQGQLLITSQSERLWKDYRRPAERIELGEQAEVREE